MMLRPTVYPMAEDGNPFATDIGAAIRWLDIGARGQAMQAISRAINRANAAESPPQPWFGYPNQSPYGRDEDDGDDDREAHGRYPRHQQQHWLQRFFAMPGSGCQSVALTACRNSKADAPRRLALLRRLAASAPRSRWLCSAARTPTRHREEDRPMNRRWGHAVPAAFTLVVAFMVATKPLNVWAAALPLMLALLWIAVMREDQGGRFLPPVIVTILALAAFVSERPWSRELSPSLVIALLLIAALPILGWSVAISRYRHDRA
jgi:hypothetical protein